MISSFPCHYFSHSASTRSIEAARRGKKKQTTIIWGVTSTFHTAVECSSYLVTCSYIAWIYSKFSWMKHVWIFHLAKEFYWFLFANLVGLIQNHWTAMNKSETLIPYHFLRISLHILLLKENRTVSYIFLNSGKEDETKLCALSCSGVHEMIHR